MAWLVRLILSLALILVVSGAQAQDYRLLQLDGQFVKWGAPQLGSGADITYSLVRQPLRLADAINCRSLAPMSALRGEGNAPVKAVAAAARAAFDMWEAVADVRFREIDVNAAADILIGVQGTPRGIAFANVTPVRSAAPVAALRRAAVCLNPRRRWQAEDGAAAGAFSVRLVLAHEIGHTIGLNHPGPSGQLMGYRYAGGPGRLQPGDVAGAVTLYGARAGRPERGRAAEAAPRHAP